MTDLSEVWIADSTPLIVLAKIGHLDLMSAFATVLVPRAVADEVLSGEEGDLGCQDLEAEWGKIISDEPVPNSLADLRLDRGEEAVLAAALARPGSRAVLDDKAARSAAIGLNVPVIGTFGIIARAKATGSIIEARPLVVSLLSVGFRASDMLVSQVLTGLGEAWP